MAVQISLFTSAEGWWKGYPPPLGPRTDIFHRSKTFKAGRVTLLTVGDGWVTGIARGGRRTYASDYHKRMTFDQISSIGPISLSELVTAVGARLRPSVTRVLADGFGLFTEAASEVIIQWIAESHPDASAVLHDVVGAEPNWMASAPDQAAHYRAERDAVNLAIEISGFDRQALLGDLRDPPVAGHFTFNDDRLVREDAIVSADLQVFPGWNAVESPFQPDGHVYEDIASGRRLTILLANKNPIEEATGVDLVYQVHDYRSFVFVQYKRVQGRGIQRSVRLDDQLDAELARMRRLEENLKPVPEEKQGLDDDRLSQRACFFKLCESEQPAEVTDLSRGKYVSLQTWHLMERNGLLRGPRGGRSLDYDRVERYINNTTFAGLVSEGWVGSVGSQFERALEIAFKGYDAGRDLVLGSLQLGGSRRRGRSDRQRIVGRPLGHPPHASRSRQ